MFMAPVIATVLEAMAVLVVQVIKGYTFKLFESAKLYLTALIKK